VEGVIGTAERVSDLGVNGSNGEGVNSSDVSDVSDGGDGEDFGDGRDGGDVSEGGEEDVSEAHGCVLQKLQSLEELHEVSMQTMMDMDTIIQRQQDENAALKMSHRQCLGRLAAVNEAVLLASLHSPQYSDISMMMSGYSWHMMRAPDIANTSDDSLAYTVEMCADMYLQLMVSSMDGGSVPASISTLPPRAPPPTHWRIHPSVCRLIEKSMSDIPWQDEMRRIASTCKPQMLKHMSISERNVAELQRIMHLESFNDELVKQAELLGASSTDVMTACCRTAAQLHDALSQSLHDHAMSNGVYMIINRDPCCTLAQQQAVALLFEEGADIPTTWEYLEYGHVNAAATVAPSPRRRTTNGPLLFAVAAARFSSLISTFIMRRFLMEDHVKTLLDAAGLPDVPHDLRVTAVVNTIHAFTGEIGICQTLSSITVGQVNNETRSE
jgi:hypothetical protein